MEKRAAYRKSIGRTTVPPGTLAEQVQYGKPVTDMPIFSPKSNSLWRTPDAAAGGSNLPGIKKALDEGHLKRPSGQPIQIRLQDQVKEPRLWPTPQHTDHLMNQSEMIEAWKKRATEKKKQGINLQFALRHAVQTWPTPREFMYKDSTTDRGKGNLGEKVGGQLNPMWVEWLMGYPPGWTDLKR